MKITRPLAGLNPPTVHTLAYQVRWRYWNAVRLALVEARNGDALGVAKWCEQANSMVLVMYDINVDNAYSYMRRICNLQDKLSKYVSKTV